jgi:hypothetical protein
MQIPVQDMHLLQPISVPFDHLGGSVRFAAPQNEVTV